MYLEESLKSYWNFRKESRVFGTLIQFLVGLGIYEIIYQSITVFNFEIYRNFSLAIIISLIIAVGSYPFKQSTP